MQSPKDVSQLERELQSAHAKIEALQSDLAHQKELLAAKTHQYDSLCQSLQAISSQHPGSPQTGHGTHRLQDTETPVTKRARLDDYLHDNNDGNGNDQDSHDVDAATVGSAADNTSDNNVEDAVDVSDGYIDLDDPDFDNIMALEDDVERPWSELSSAVQDALRTFLGGKPDWFDKLMEGQGKFCLSRKNRAADHLFDGKYVACKSCAYTHDFCVSKFGTGNAARVVLRPLCAVDCAVYPNPPTFADVEYFRLPSTVNYAPSKNDKTQYANVH